MGLRRRRKYPKSIKEHRLFWVYKKIWSKPHNKNQMFSAVTCGRPGSGKSWLDLSMAETLDRSEVDVDRFSIDRVYFSAAEFAEGMAKKHPRGTVHVFDDVGLHLFSREAMTRTVRDIAKIFQSIRYKNYILLLSLPGFGMLDKVVRELVDAYIQPVGIDYELCRNECKFHWLQTNPMKGKIYSHKLSVMVPAIHPLLDYKTMERRKFETIWIDKPSDKLARQYEKKKQDFMGEYYRETAADIKAREARGSKGRQTQYQFYYPIIKENIHKYWKEGKEGKVVDYNYIVAQHPDCSQTTAAMIARVLTAEIKMGIDNKKPQ